MKTLAVLLVAAVVTQTVHGQESIRPIVAAEFGKQITVQAEFAAKPNDYYSQNFVAAPYLLKVVAVEGRKLKEPIFIEYDLQVEKNRRTQIERPGVSVALEAYESLYQPSIATPWLATGEQGMAFALIHLLHVRLPQKKG
jgi:hypothetical protein